MPCVIDHFVIGAASLDDGAGWLEQRLGVPLADGGAHFKMGTFNKLLRIGETTYLEIIAIDPAAAQPPRRRWFGLDEPAIQARCQPAALLTWAVRTPDIQALTAQSPLSMGQVHPMSRSTLNWFITIPDSGQLVAEGAYPFAIEWLGSQHPTQKLPHRGVSLKSLEIGTPDKKGLMAALNAIHFKDAAMRVNVIEADRFHLTLRLKTPKGEVEIGDAAPVKNETKAVGHLPPPLIEIEHAQAERYEGASIDQPIGHLEPKTVLRWRN